MPIIKGTHGRIEPTGALPPLAKSLPAPNQSFRYLTLDTESITAQTLTDALLPTTDTATVIELLKELGTAMVESSDHNTGNSTIPPVYTYWGQFIDHDITAGTDRPGSDAQSRWTADILDSTFAPVAPANVIGLDGIFNLRRPFLDLDSLYGGGPDDPETIAEQIYLKDQPGSGAAATDPRLAVGEISGSATTVPDAFLPEPHLRDLPRRDDRTPRIGDERNDENTIVSQFHTAFLRFHNAVVDFMETCDGHTPTFDEAAQLVRWHYQWLIVNDYLRTICQPAVVDKLLADDTHFFSATGDAFMPLEFSVAAFRFGHSMVRANYDFNPTFSSAHFSMLFTFTGGGGLGGSLHLPNIWVIDWRRFVDKTDGNRNRFARKIDTNLALPLTNLPSVGSGIVKHLAQRNLLRSYLLSVPTAQHVAEQLGLLLMPEAALVPSDKPALRDVFDAQEGLFKEKTPLWYYILREAEVQEGGNRLGPLGSHLVAGTLISLIKADPSSYLNQGWSPTAANAVSNPEGPIQTIADLLQFAGVMAKIHKIFTPIVMG